MTQVETPPPRPATDTAAPGPRSIKAEAANGVAWTSFIHGFRVATSLLTTIVLAWMLGPDAFGIVGSATIVVGFLLLFKDLGTGSAIVQKQDLSPEVLSSVFWANVIIGIAGTLSLYLAAPAVAWFFDDPRLVPVLQVLGVVLFLAGVGVTHQSLMQKELRFALLAKTEAVAILAGAVTGVVSAVLGAGVWALVLQALVTTGLATGLTIALHAWRPRLHLRIADIGTVSQFSLNLTGSNVLNYLVRNADQLFILKFLGTFELGLYALACKMLLLPISSINAVLNRVLFPLYSRIQDDDARLRNAFLKTTATIALVMFPCLIGFATVADSLVAGVLPASWSPIVPLTAALAIVGLVQSVATSSGTIYMAKGRTDLLLLWTIATGVFAVTGFAVGVQWGALGVAQAYAVLAVLLFLPGMALVLRLIDTPLSQFLGTCWRPLFCAVSMGAGIWWLGLITAPNLSPIQDLAVRIPAGIALYLTLTLALNREHLGEVLAAVRGRETAKLAPTRDHTHRSCS